MEHCVHALEKCAVVGTGAIKGRHVLGELNSYLWVGSGIGVVLGCRVLVAVTVEEMLRYVLSKQYQKVRVPLGAVLLWEQIAPRHQHHASFLQSVVSGQQILVVVVVDDSLLVRA